MSTRTEKHNKKEEQKKLAVRIVCLTLAVLLSLSAFVGILSVLAV